MPSHTKVVSGLGKSVPMPAAASIGIGDAGGCPRAGAKGVSTIQVGGSGSVELGLDQQNPWSSKGWDLWCHLHGCHPVSARRLWGKRGAGGTGCPWGPWTQLPDAEPVQPCVAPGGKGCRGGWGEMWCAHVAVGGDAWRDAFSRASWPQAPALPVAGELGVCGAPLPCAAPAATRRDTAACPCSSGCGHHHAERLGSLRCPTHGTPLFHKEPPPRPRCSFS